MGESAVALRYAEALYALAREGQRTQEVLGQLAEVKASLDADPARWRRLLHPRAPAKEKEALLVEGPLQGKDAWIVNLFRLLLRRKRESIIPDLFRSYLSVHESHERILRVSVESATPLSPDAEGVLKQKIQDATGRDVSIESRTVPDLLGGLRLQIGSMLVDGSVRSRLERLHRVLKSAPVGN